MGSKDIMLLLYGSVSLITTPSKPMHVDIFLHSEDE